MEKNRSQSWITCPLVRRSRRSWSHFAGKAMKKNNHLQKLSDCRCHINSPHDHTAQKMSRGHGIGGTQKDVYGSVWPRHPWLATLCADDDCQPCSVSTARNLVICRSVAGQIIG